MEDYADFINIEIMLNQFDEVEELENLLQNIEV